MKKYFLGFIVGISVSLMIFIPLLLSEQQNKFEFGKNSGIIRGVLFSVKAIEKEFGVLENFSKYKVLYSVKTSDVVVVEINGTKTVRVIP